MRRITRESLQNEKFSLSVLLNKIGIHGAVSLQITLKPSITVLTNSVGLFFFFFHITLPLNRKASRIITGICLSSIHWYLVPFFGTHTVVCRTQACPSGKAHNASFVQNTMAHRCPTTHGPTQVWQKFLKAAWCVAALHPAKSWDTQRWRRNIFRPSNSQAQHPSSPSSLMSHPCLCLAQAPGAPWQETAVLQHPAWIWATFAKQWLSQLNTSDVQNGPASTLGHFPLLAVRGCLGWPLFCA